MSEQHRGWRDTPLTRLVGVDLPVVVAPMAGGPTTPELVAAVCEAGALGVLAGGYRTPEQLRADVERVRALTTRPFGINLLVPPPEPLDPEQLRRATELLRPYGRELGVDLVPAPPEESTFDDLVAVVVDARPALFSFTFGIPTAEHLDAVRAAGTVICGTATTVREAQALDAASVDVVCAQGAEAGGHRGGFLSEPDRALVGLVSLVPQVVDAVDRPVLAAGGIADGRGIAAALALGAAGAQLGTAFLDADEAGTTAPYREALRQATDESTVVTSAITGKPARGIANRLATGGGPGPHPPYPELHLASRPLRQHAARLGRSEYLSLWAGQSVSRARQAAAATIVRQLAEETDAVVGTRP